MTTKVRRYVLYGSPGDGPTPERAAAVVAQMERADRWLELLEDAGPDVVQNDWEATFISSVRKQRAAHRILTPKQLTKLEQIATRAH
jgi:hypothetical protein